jgi:hypothetical protein
MPLGDLAREDDYGEADPWTAAANALQRRYAGRNIARGPGAERDPNDVPPAWLTGALERGAETVAFPGRYMAGPDSAYPSGSEEAQFLADSRERSATDWGRKMGFNTVFDPVPGLMGLASGGSPRGSMGSVGSGAGQGIKAYHSSPHDFERFDASRIGTGEGAQVYGHGIYFAENPAISGRGGQYWGQFLNRFPENEQLAAVLLREHGFDRNKVMSLLEADRAKLKSWESDPTPSLATWKRDNEALRKVIETGKPVGPRTYEVNIKARPEEMLDWDKRLREQPEAIQSTLKRMVPYLSENYPGSQFYANLEALRGGAGKQSPLLASQALNEAGIPGIRYLDRGSRAAGEGSRNYVMFPGAEDRIAILRKYGLAGMAPAGAAMGGLAQQDQY